MGILAALCVLAGVVPGIALDALAPAAEAVLGGRLSPQVGEPWLTLVPVAATRSSYNGLLVLAFVTISASMAAWAVHRFASRELRRGPAWDCGFPSTDPATQYGAASFAQPVRRVFATTLLRAREAVDMPPPGDPRPARLAVETTDLVWTGIYLRIGDVVGAIATRANRLQFLTIRRYLTLVFLSLVLLLLGLALWS
jgi:hydrogenase-4 component B